MSRVCYFLCFFRVDGNCQGLIDFSSQNLNLLHKICESRWLSDQFSSYDAYNSPRSSLLLRISHWTCSFNCFEEVNLSFAYNFILVFCAVKFCLDMLKNLFKWRLPSSSESHMIFECFLHDKQILWLCVAPKVVILRILWFLVPISRYCAVYGM